MTRGDWDNAFGETGVCKHDAESEGVKESGGVRLASRSEDSWAWEPKCVTGACCMVTEGADEMSVAECMVAAEIWSVTLAGECGTLKSDDREMVG